MGANEVSTVFHEVEYGDVIFFRQAVNDVWWCGKVQAVKRREESPLLEVACVFPYVTLLYVREEFLGQLLRLSAENAHRFDVSMPHLNETDL